MLQRNLLYTAITRGKRLAVLVGTKKAVAIAVKNHKIQLRYTGLARRLQKGRPDEPSCHSERSEESVPD
jgi:exodeoxyribonuclease V alpha subunit